MLNIIYSAAALILDGTNHNSLKAFFQIYGGDVWVGELGEGL